MARRDAVQHLIRAKEHQRVGLRRHRVPTALRVVHAQAAAVTGLVPVAVEIGDGREKKVLAKHQLDLIKN